MTRSLRVVAVDDNPLDRALVRRTFRRMTRYQVELVEFDTAEKALDHTSEHELDALLLDFQLCSVDAVEVLGILRERGDDYPVIVLTGHESPELAVELVHAGASDFLPKSRLSVQSLQRSLSNALEKAQLRAEILAQRREIEERNALLEERNESITQFSHHVSHELKNPLTSALEFLSIVLDGIGGELSDEQREYLGIAHESCGELSRLLGDLVDVTRLDTGKLSLRIESVDLRDVVTRTVESLRPSAEKAEIELVEHFADEPCTVDIDPGRFRQIVSNLVGNALKFTPSGGSITVRTTQGDGQCWIEVADTGRGIPEDQFDAVFDRLHQVTEGDQVVGGLGIGLNVCREIARMHRGDILVESELGKGSVFRVLVPAAVANGEGEGERVGSEEAEIAPQFA